MKMLRITRCVSKPEIHFKHAYAVRLSTGNHSSSAEKSQSESSHPPPPPRKSGGVFWKLLGLTLTGAGGVVGYAWYDSSFKTAAEANVPYLHNAFSVLFQYLPPSPQSASSVEQTRSTTTSHQPNAVQSQISTATIQKPTVVQVQELPLTEPVLEIAQPVPVPVESKKEIAEREAREKKQKAQELLRQRELQEASENLALETGIESLLEVASQSVQAAASAHQVAAREIRTHTERLKNAMEEGSTEYTWETLTDNQQSRADAVWSSEQAAIGARESLDKLHRAIVDGRANPITKRNKVLSAAEKELSRFEKELSSATKGLAESHAAAKKLSDFRDLVKLGKEQFKKELQQLGGEENGTQVTGEKLTELNSLVVHAHRRIDQLQRELIEKQALEPIRIEAALAAAKEEDEKSAIARIANERDKSVVELEMLRRRWEADAEAEFEAELRTQLARQTGAHSDHLVEALRNQRKQLLDQFGKELNERVEIEKYRLHAQVSASLTRMKAIDAAIESRAENERAGCRARELWLACRALVSVVKEGRPIDATSDEPIPICAELDAVRDAGSEYPMVHVALSSVPELVLSRGIYTTDALVRRFTRVRKVARRVAMVDETGGSMARYILSYVQSFFVLRAKPVRGEVVDISDMSTFAILDNAEDCLRRGDFEQAVRYVNALRGESRRAATTWLDEARVLLETRQAAELLMAFAAASGLGSVE